MTVNTAKLHMDEESASLIEVVLAAPGSNVALDHLTKLGFAVHAAVIENDLRVTDDGPIRIMEIE